MGATMGNEVDTERDRDAIAHAHLNIKLSEQAAEGKLDTSIYRGEHAYPNYMKVTEDDLKMKMFSGYQTYIKYIYNK